MAVRKGWDALTEKYRSRLIHNGITQRAYEQGASLARGRGKQSQAHEAFSKRVTRFTSTHGSGWYSASERRWHQHSEAVEAERIRAMGPTRGQEYIDYRRQMTKLYEQGKYAEARAMFERRNTRITRDEGMWWYHGMFGG